MPVQQTILQVFVASPSDVSEERKLLEEVIGELNRTWADSLGVTYRLYRWEANVAPGFGVEPQAVVNSQTPSEYDVFVGIFWGRLGTPTQSFLSGTVEEFERALERYESSGAPEIMVYFKDAPISPSKIEPDQLQSLMQFKGSLSARGGLYSTFEDQDGFEASLRSHLAAVARKFSGRNQVAQRAPNQSEAKLSGDREQADYDFEDLGYLDYIDIYVAETDKLTTCLEKVCEITVDIGNKFTERTKQINDAESSPSRARTFMLMSADDMNQYSKELDVQLNVYRTSKTNSFDALSKSVSLHSEIIGRDENILSLQESLKGLFASISETRSGITGMRDAAAGLPRMTKEINRAKKTIVEALDRFLSEVDSTIATASNIIDSIEQMV